MFTKGAGGLKTTCPEKGVETSTCSGSCGPEVSSGPSCRTVPPAELQRDASLCRRRSTQIKTYSWDNAQVLLVGNKCDMEDERVVSGDRARQLSEHLGEITHTYTNTHTALLIFVIE